MCLGIPGQLVGRVEGYGGQLVLVDVMGAVRQVNIGMLEDDEQASLAIGSWVLIHMGFAVEIVDEAGAERAMSGLEMMGQPRETRERRRFQVHGVVQGVGFRPFVYVSATELELAGSVVNDAAGVTIEVEGAPAAVAEFGRRLVEAPPPLALVESIESIELEVRGGTGFVIESTGPADRARTLAAPDVATCADCRRELADPLDRRFAHPFISCTNCGPRFTIMTGLPYDRAATTMAGFPMCAACRAEYEDPRDRRFHAQPIACHDCGPVLQYLDGSHQVIDVPDPLRAARESLREGLIIAIKGLGGYHLACDASNERAVAELRRRKQRGDKPFALMVPDLAVADQLAQLDDDERTLLSGARRPIVLLQRRAGTDLVAASVAPGSPDLGLMLPYTPLHELLFAGNRAQDDEPSSRVLVLTSGNLGGEPIVTDDDEALTRLAGLVDGWLRHDRPIHVPVDDSVVRIVDGVEMAIRRSRGYAPLPVALAFDVAPVLAVGADLKSTCCVAEGRYAWLSQHIGDMDDLATIDAFTATASHLQRLTGVNPLALVADAHPAYRSSRWAATHADSRPVATVQHHHAHIASVLAEHGLDGSVPVIGFAFDGTGYGDDGAIWGGEVLVADYKQYRRVEHLAYVPLAGGDASVERPYRMALAHLWAAGIEWDEALPCVAACPAAERVVLRHQLETGFGCTPTSSIGRLFDAVASLLGVRQDVAYEAQAAIELEGLARGVRSEAGYEFAIEPNGDFAAAPVLRAIIDDQVAGVDKMAISARFHQGVAELILAAAGRERDRSGLNTVALGGGVFQNIVLLSTARRLLNDAGFAVLVPSRLPPNDGGLALGQLMIAATR